MALSVQDPRFNSSQAVLIGQKAQEQQAPLSLSEDECYKITLPEYFGSRELYFDDPANDSEAGMNLPMPNVMQLPKCYEFDPPSGISIGGMPDEGEVIAHRAVMLQSCGIFLEVVDKPDWWKDIPKSHA